MASCVACDSSRRVVPPYSMKDDKLKLIGSDVETAELLAKDLGLARGWSG